MSSVGKFFCADETSELELLLDLEYRLDIVVGIVVFECCPCSCCNTLLHWDGGLEDACELPGLLEWRLPVLLQDSGFVLQQLYNFGGLFVIPSTKLDETVGEDMI